MAKNKLSIGVDLGGTTVKVGLVTQDGKILYKESLDTRAFEGPKAVIGQIKKGIKLILKNKSKHIEGIGIGSPGVVSSKKGTVEYPPNLPGWKRIKLGQQIEKYFGIKTYVENDANAAAIGELIFGAGKNLNDFFMITLGTGVGGGIIINKKIYRGESGAAGEIGHVSIDYKGNKCNCGNYGCIETYVGINYLVDRVKKEISGVETKIKELIDGDLDKLTPKIIKEAADLNDDFSKEIIKKSGEYLGSALTSMINSMDIANIIIGGGVAGFGVPLFNSMKETIKDRCLKSLAPRVKIIPAKLKNEAGIKGASALVYYKS